jgi:hypothetical protein
MTGNSGCEFTAAGRAEVILIWRFFRFVSAAGKDRLGRKGVLPEYLGTGCANRGKGRI